MQTVTSRELQVQLQHLRTTQTHNGGGGLLVNTPGGSHFTADASTNVTTTYSLDSDLRGNVHFIAQILMTFYTLRTQV